MGFDHIGEMIGPVSNPFSFLLEKVLLLVLKHIKIIYINSLCPSVCLSLSLSYFKLPWGGEE
jgi:hypothetical protein